MDKMRDMHIAEMNRIKDAIVRSKSPYLKADYYKAYKRMEKELAEYDRYRYQS